MTAVDSWLTEQYRNLLSIASGAWLSDAGQPSPTAPPGLRRVRDLHFLPLLGDISLVVACDSNASIGEKPHDGLPKPYSEVGISALKVPMMEVLATGAQPLLIVNALCMEMDPSGQKFIEAMRGELIRCGFDPDLMLTGSTEDNVPTVQSGIGVTVIGLVTNERLRTGRTAPGDVVVCVGTPKGGVDLPYAEGEPDIASISTVQALAALNEEVHEILPVGSKGVVYEARELAAGVSGEFVLAEPPPEINLYGSAGASTAVLVSVRPGAIGEVSRALTEPMYVVGIVR